MPDFSLDNLELLPEKCKFIPLAQDTCPLEKYAMNGALMAQRHYSQRSWFKPKERSKQSCEKNMHSGPSPQAQDWCAKTEEKKLQKLNMNGYIILLETQHNHIWCWIEMEANLTWVKKIMKQHCFCLFCMCCVEFWSQTWRPNKIETTPVHMYQDIDRKCCVYSFPDTPITKHLMHSIQRRICFFCCAQNSFFVLRLVKTPLYISKNLA